MPALNGWHPGERAIQAKLGYAQPMAMAYTWIDGELPEQHRIFHMTNIPFLPVTTLDAEGRPWGSVLAAEDGRPGFVDSPNESKLVLRAKTWKGDPIRGTLERSARKGKGALIAGIGIDFGTRRRNKFAGKIDKVTSDGVGELDIDLTVTQAIGNCPKYINVRDLIPHPHTSPRVLYDAPSMASEDRLPDEVISLIHDADTVFIGTTYVAKKEEERRFPSHVGMNQRGGRQGFVRVSPSDGRTVILPDYSGNRLMTSLGNIEATPLASLTFISFSTGAVLYLTGTAQTHVGPAAQAIMPLQNALTAIRVTGYVLVDDALPLRQRPGSSVLRSPYSPPIKLLAEETASGTTFFGSSDSDSATLTRIAIHSPTLATFAFRASQPLRIVPGQAVILDFTSFLGPAGYAHMAPGKPTAVNDDRIRTWTVSSAHTANGTTECFDLTMREKPGGAVTGALFALARKLAQVRPEVLEDMRPLEISVRVVGVSGDFVLPLPSAVLGKRRTLFWVAGGVGITPFLSMLASLASSDSAKLVDGWNIHLILATREPDVLLPLVEQALEIPESASAASKAEINLTVDVFSIEPVPSSSPRAGVKIRHHAGRLSQDALSKAWGGIDTADAEAYVCGPPEFEEAAVEGMEALGIERRRVKREGFAY